VAHFGRRPPVLPKGWPHDTDGLCPSHSTRLTETLDPVISFLPSSSIFYMSKPPLHALNGIGDFGTTTRPQLVLLRIDPSSPLCLFTRFCFILLPVPDPDAQPLACFLFSSFSDMRGRPLTALWPAPFLVSPFFWSAVRSPSVTGRVTEYESAARGRLRL